MATEFDWIIGVGLSFGMAIFFAYITFKNARAFMLYFTGFVGFFVFAGNLELWMLVSCVIVDVMILYTTYRKGSDL